MGVNITDIAKRAGVSKATVSRVMNNASMVKEETRRKVMQAIESLDYQPNAAAKSLATSHSTVIGVILPTLDNALYAKIFKGISNTVSKYGLETILCLTEESREKEKQSLLTLKTHRVRGILLFPSDRTEEDRFFPEDFGVPLVIIGSDAPRYHCDSILIDDFRGAYEATAALIEAGHTSIGILTGDLQKQVASERYRGFCSAMKRYKLPVCEDFVYHGEFTTASGGDMARQLLATEQRPTAVFASDNQIAMGCMWHFYNQHFRIPDDLALIAFDDGNILQMVGVDLSVVSVDPEYIGSKATAMLIEDAENQLNMSCNRLIIVPRVILRGSEKKPGKA